MNPLYDVPVEATVDDIKFLYDGGEVEVDYNASDGDVVRLTIEPLEVKVTDGFRAAVKKACKCDSSSGGGSGGGSTGGGVLVVHETASTSGEGTLYTLDRTYAEIASTDAVLIVRKHEGADGEVAVEYSFMDMYAFADGRGYAVHFGSDLDDRLYLCSSASEYPTYTEGGK